MGRLRVIAIAAVSENGVIGSGSGMLWRLPEDFRRFRRRTTGHTLIFGRKTHEEVGLLPDRRTIVLTRQEEWSAPGVEVARSVEEALELASATMDRICFVGGGAQVYEAAWPYLTEMDITLVKGSYNGDARFPKISPDEWAEVWREPHDEFDFVRYLPAS